MTDFPYCSRSNTPWRQFPSRSWQTIRVGLYFVMLLSFTPVFAQDSAPAGTTEAEDGFVTVFNGKDLTGWREVQGKPGAFWVEAGVLCGDRRKFPGAAYWLSTEAQYGDFELRLEYKLPSGGNSGVFIHVPSYKGRTSQVGMEIQLLDDAGKTGTPSSNATGAVYTVVAPSAFAAKPANEWNTLAIRCQGPEIRVTVNGNEVTKVDVDQEEKLKSRPRQGYIGLSAHTHQVYFRNIRIKGQPIVPATTEQP